MTSPKDLEQRVATAAARRRAAKKARRSSVWTQAMRVGALGWMIALPIVGGAAGGHVLDRVFDTGISFSLALLLVGVFTGGYVLWAEVNATK